MRRILIMLCLFVAWSAAGQRTISGRAVASNGSAIEYANVGVEGKGVGVVADSKGGFTLNIPDKLLNDTLTISHVSYEELRLPVATLGTEEVFTLTPKSYVAREVVVNAKKQKIRTFDGHGVRLPGGVVAFSRDEEYKSAEIGSLVEVDDDFMIAGFKFAVLSSNGNIKARINVYRIEGAEVRNILNYPIYVDMENSESPIDYSVTPEDVIVLENGQYFIGIEIVENTVADVPVKAVFPLYIKQSLKRYGNMGPFEKMPFNIGLVVKGRVLS